jgi:hypothetical protein
VSELSDQYEETWGHFPEEIKINTTFWILLQNPGGLKLTTDTINTQYALSLFQSTGAGVICLAETNTNWSLPLAHSKFNTMIKKTWRHCTYQTSHLPDDFQDIKQPGGTTMLLTNNWTSRLIEKGEDPFGLGRWSYMILRGKESTKIAIISAYIVCTQSISSAGPTTSTTQQFRKLSKTLREINDPHTPQPRLQFILDLQAWLQHLVQTGHDIILCLDANEDINTVQGTFTPLDYDPKQPTVGLGHNGSLSTLCCTCGLVDPLTLQHSDSPPPPTYSRGSSRLDYILVSQRVVKHVTRSGILPYNSFFLSDHRPCFIDIDSESLFQSQTFPIAPAQQRGLQLYDPRVVEKFEGLLKQVEYHKLERKINDHHQQSLTVIGSLDLHKEYETIDKLLGESMKYSEKKAARVFSTKYEWSPVLFRAVNTLRFWTVCLKRAKGFKVADSRLRLLLTTSGIETATLPPVLTLPIIVKYVCTSRSTLKELQKKHVEHRQFHLQSLAEAIVEKRNPALTNPDRLENKKKKTIWNLIWRERLKKMHRKINRQLHPSKSMGALARVDIPATETDSPYPVGPDPKEWKGPWKLITDPSTIADHVCSANHRQYHQAHDTPMGQDPLLSTFEYKADTTASDNLINYGIIPYECLQNQLPETINLLKTLAKK